MVFDTILIEVLEGAMTATPELAIQTPNVVQFLRVLADETRLAIVQLLTLSDLRAGEVVERLKLPQNAVSYHLRQLRSIGVLRDRRSSNDARDVYYSLDLDKLHALYLATGDTLGTRLPDDECALDERDKPLRILFLCTHNSARSQLAEAIARKLGGDNVEVASAGSEPSRVHPQTIELLREMGIDPNRHRSKSMDEFVGQHFDYVITVCDRVRDSCPTFPGDPKQIHWSFPDPTKEPEGFEQRRAFDHLRRELETRLRYLLCLPHPRTGSRIEIPLRSGEAGGDQ
jgi:ArsR family transcriptional regulator, arsenate/arsenite/antimonite-responsive transcriptional repressor / arsenate reductase (thioredoxin)